MEQIAERAPVSKRTLYAHFRTEDELVLAHLKGLASAGHTLEGALVRARRPTVLAEQLVTLADGAASRAMVLDEADYGRHARRRRRSSWTTRCRPPSRRARRPFASRVPV
jgi:AcrR family transcriptional regulator